MKSFKIFFKFLKQVKNKEDGIKKINLISRTFQEYDTNNEEEDDEDQIYSDEEEYEDDDDENEIKLDASNRHIEER